MVIASCIILFLNPEYVFHPSFQLSFVAVLSLISGYEFYQKNKWVLGESKGIFAIIKFYIASNIYSSFLVSIVTAPVVINNFYIFSSYSVPINLLAVPIMSFVLMPLALLSIILMPIGIDAYILKIMGFFINIIINAANYVNHLPGSVWYFGYTTSASIIIFLFGFFWLCLWQTSWRLFGIVLIVVSFFLMCNSPKPDYIVDNRLQAVGVKNESGLLEIYTNKMSGFTRIYWANWYGQKDAVVKKLDLDIPSFLKLKGISKNLEFDSEKATLLYCIKNKCKKG